jgi:hypothetical protein
MKNNTTPLSITAPIAPAVTFPPLIMKGMIGIAEPTNVDPRTTISQIRGEISAPDYYLFGKDL